MERRLSYHSSLYGPSSLCVVFHTSHEPLSERECVPLLLVQDLEPSTKQKNFLEKIHAFLKKVHGLDSHLSICNLKEIGGKQLKETGGKSYLNAKVNMYKTANVKKYSGGQAFSFPA